MKNNVYFNRMLTTVATVLVVLTVISMPAMSQTALKRVNVPRFDKIEIGDLVKVEFQQGSYPGYVEIETIPSFVDNVDVEVKDGKLNLGCHVDTNHTELSLVVKVKAPELREITMSGVTSLLMEGQFSFDDSFRLKTVGVNEVSFGEVMGNKMSIDADGVTKIYMVGAELDQLDIDADGVADIRLKGLNVGHIKASSQSASNIVLGGRCRSISKHEDGMASTVNTKGLIIESVSPRTSTKDSGKSMPRIP